jgi:hypothetical protein
MNPPLAIMKLSKITYTTSHIKDNNYNTTTSKNNTNHIKFQEALINTKK